MSLLDELKAEWIWLPAKKETVNQYVDFRHEFFISREEAGMGEGDGLLHISVDTEYALWLNGAFVDCNQYDDYPWNKAYDVLDVRKHLKAGRNTLCVRVYYQGEGSYQYIPGQPGLLYAMKLGAVQVASGAGVLCRQCGAYTNGAIEKISPQLSYTFHYNAAKDDDWLLEVYRPETRWAQAQVCGRMKEDAVLYERPVNKVTIGEPVEGKIAAQGLFLRKGTRVRAEDGGPARPTTAELLQRDYLSFRLPMEVFQKDCGYEPGFPSAGLRIGRIADGNDGVYLVIDLQREETGYFELEMDGEEGTVVEAAYGEQLDDLRVRASMGGRNFAFRYICREGKQRFTHYFKRIAGRYIQLHISKIRESATIYYAGIRTALYPVLEKGGFLCGDRLLNRIYEVSVRTLRLCMHEHYEDTPWREQAMYAMDSRNQALCGYYCFGEYDFAERSLSLFAENVGEDGMLEICAPARDRITIPSFSMGWILSVADFVLYSGRVGTAKRLLPVVKRMLEAYAGNMRNGLLKTPSGQRYWNFYEWAEGLDGGWTFDAPFKSEGPEEFDAPLNLFFCLALDAGAKLAGWCGDREMEACCKDRLDRLRAAVHEFFWDEKEQAYRNYLDSRGGTEYAELTQALALCSGAAPDGIAKELRRRLSRKDAAFVRTTLSYSFYKYEALLQEAEQYGSLVFEDIAADWGHMLYNKATSFWETIRGANDFEKAGSLCHGWSAIPAYFFHAYLLGVKPSEPGFRRFTAIPSVCGADRYSGRIPTPYGDITVRGDIGGNGAEYLVNCPMGTEY